MSESPARYLALPEILPPVPDVPATWVGGHDVHLLCGQQVSLIRCDTCRRTAPLFVEPIGSAPWLAWVQAFTAAHPAQGTTTTAPPAPFRWYCEVCKAVRDTIEYRGDPTPMYMGGLYTPALRICAECYTSEVYPYHPGGTGT